MVRRTQAAPRRRGKARKPTTAPVALLDAAAWLLNRPMLLERGRLAAMVAALWHTQSAGLEPEAFFGFMPNEEPAPPFDLVGRVAVVPVRGVLVARTEPWMEWFGGAFTSYERIGGAFAEAVAEDAAEVVVLDLDSPGGDVAGLFDLVDRMRAVSAAAGKPVHAIANESAFSAAYAIASVATTISVSRTAGVGSVGVIAEHVSWARFNERMGIDVTAVFAGERKNDFSPDEPLSDDARELLQAEVDRLFGMFVGLVARNRGTTEERIRGLEAGVFYGEGAVAAGLADAVLPAPEALRLAAETAALARVRVVPPEAVLQLETVGKHTEKPEAGNVNDTPEVEAPAEATAVAPAAAEPAAISGAAPAAATDEAAVNEKVAAAVREAIAARRAWEAEVVSRCEAVHRPDLAAKLIADEVPEDALGERITAELAKAAAPEIISTVNPVGSGAVDSPLVRNAKEYAARFTRVTV